MLNQTPLWKYLVLIFIIGICALYATPNLYGEDHAVQISAGRNATVDDALLNQVTETLATQGIASKSIVLDNQQILVRL
ncbi:MAG: protein translocase subunit SecD, partial [Paraglaciecola polaris]